MRQKLMEPHKEIDEFTILAEGFNTPLLEMNRSSKEKISKDIVQLLWFECLFFPNPPNSNVEILIPKVMIFGDGPLGGNWVMRVGHDGISAFIRRDRRALPSSLSALCHVRIQV